MATLINIALGANMFFSSPQGDKDCCRLEPSREKYLPSKEIPYQEVEKNNSNTYAIREEELVYSGPAEVYSSEPFGPNFKLNKINYGKKKIQNNNENFYPFYGAGKKSHNTNKFKQAPLPEKVKEHRKITNRIKSNRWAKRHNTSPERWGY